MNLSPTEIRSASADRMPRAVAAIVAAFLTDPPARFAWPGVHDYLAAMPTATRALAGTCGAAPLVTTMLRRPRRG